jgi:hypothetical protein
MTDAYHAGSALEAEAALLALAKELDRTHPGAAASLREGLDETLTVLRLNVPPTLARTEDQDCPCHSYVPQPPAHLPVGRLRVADRVDFSDDCKVGISAAQTQASGDVGPVRHPAWGGAVTYRRPRAARVQLARRSARVR